MQCKKITFLLIFLTFTSLLVSKEVDVYFLLHGLYSSNSYWNELIKSDEFKKASFVFGGNFEVDEDLLVANRYIVSEDLKGKLDTQLEEQSKLVYTISFDSGFRNSFRQQALQIKEVLNKFPTEDNYNYYFVGHSMGGLAGRCYLTTICDRDIDGLITIGTPNLGSYLGNANTGLTGLIGRIFEVMQRPDNVITGISNLWKKEDDNITPALSPNSKELNYLNSLPFPDSVKSISIFSAINTQEEINSLSENEKIVHQVLQVEKLKSFNSLNPKDIEITKLYNDLYYNDGLVAITSQNLQNAIPNKYDIEAYHIPTRKYHDHEPTDVEHIIPAMKLITTNPIEQKYSLFMYSSTSEIIHEEYFRKITDMFFKAAEFRGTFVVDEEDSLYPVFHNDLVLKYDLGIFLINDSAKLEKVRSRISTFDVYPVIIDFSLNNNIEKFKEFDCIYIKIISADEAEKFAKLLSDFLGKKIIIKEDEFYKVKEQIIRYYFSDSNMTERLRIPNKWWKDQLRTFQ